MISLPRILAHTPSNGCFVWDIECPNITRSQVVPQADLLRLDPDQDRRDRVLYLPPISGHSSSLLQDIAKPAVEDFDVYVVDFHPELTRVFHREVTHLGLC